MSARKTVLDLATFSLGAVSQLANLKDASWRVDNVTEEEQPVSTRQGKVELVKRRLSIQASIMQAVTGVRQTNLNTAVYTIGAVDFLGDLRGGTLTIETVSDEGSGLADEWTYPNPVGTRISLEADQLILANATTSLFNTAGGVASGLNVTVAITVGDLVFSCPFKMTAAEKRFEDGKVILLGLEFEQRGSPTISGNTLLVLITTGLASAAYSMDDSVDTISGTCMMTRAVIRFDDAKIIDDMFSFEGQGAPTFG